jgi:hypothetical protein
MSYALRKAIGEVYFEGKQDITLNGVILKIFKCLNILTHYTKTKDAYSTDTSSASISKPMEP